MRRTAITAYLYSAAIASWLLSLLSPWSRMGPGEWINGVLLLLVVLGSAYTIIALVRGRDEARLSAWALGAYSGVMLLDRVVGATMREWSDAGPALVLSHGLIGSLWGALVVGMLLVLRLRSTARPPLQPAAGPDVERSGRTGDLQAHPSTADHPPIPWIEHLRRVQLTEAERRDRRMAAWLREHGALRLFGTIGSEGYLRPDGTTWVHEAESWGDPEDSRTVWREVQGTERWAVLTVGKKHCTLPDLPTARDVLVSQVLAAENRATAHLTGSIERAAIAEERHAIADFLRTVDESELASVEPLPYRRVLEDDELSAAWVALSDAWSIGAGYWFPLAETDRTDVAAFQAPYFERDRMPAVIRTTLLGRGVTRVWELREYGPSYELDVEALDPEYTGAEGFWCSPGFEWVVYASHESSITVGGDWLLQAVRDAWPGAEKRRWSWPFF